MPGPRGGRPPSPQLEFEEEQLLVDLGAALLDVLEERAVRGGGRVARELELRERAGARGGQLRGFVRVAGLDEFGRAEFGDAPAIALRERLGGFEARSRSASSASCAGAG